MHLHDCYGPMIVMDCTNSVPIKIGKKGGGNTCTVTGNNIAGEISWPQPPNQKGIRHLQILLHLISERK